MLFNSISFAIFLPIVFILYWMLPHRYRWGVLLVSSYYFYMSWNVKYVVLILFTTVISYFCAIWMERREQREKKRVLLIMTLIVSLGVLFIFKYCNFFLGSVYSILQACSIPVHPVTLKLLLPVGISFYTFQTLSYVIDVYRGDVKAEHHFGIYATFISFFPQLVAGPIERTKNLLPQIKEEHVFHNEKAADGLRLMAIGFFKKIVVADTLSIYVDKIYGDITNYKGLSLIMASVFFAFQVYCDFSGYSDIAIGTAKLFDIDLMTNFKSPYFSASIKEFWSRWHISLSSWFRDYVYIPLGGNRCSKLKHSRNLIVTFLVSGLWHGANWTYVIWGGIHGVAQVVENAIFRGKKKKQEQFTFSWWCRVLLVFIFCCVTWVFFRANTVSDAFYVFRNCFYNITSVKSYIKAGYADFSFIRADVYRICLILGMLVAYDFVSLKTDLWQQVKKAPVVVRWGIYLATFDFVAFYFIMYGVASSSFIYFQF